MAGRPILAYKRYSLDEEDTNSTSKSAIIEAISDITPVVRQSPPYIPIHATSRPQHAIAFPSRHTVPRVGISPRIRTTGCSAQFLHLSCNAMRAVAAISTSMSTPGDRQTTS